MDPTKKTARNDEAERRFHVLRRKRRVSQFVRDIQVAAAALGQQLEHWEQPLPEAALDHLSTASVALTACLRALSRTPRPPTR
ncbi:MAG: hypothetical protein L0Y71_08925 [Gemmataceae bacterium]|nr:hypothetical protein [Gemmataceae bacterium]